MPSNKISQNLTGNCSTENEGLSEPLRTPSGRRSTLTSCSTALAYISAPLSTVTLAADEVLSLGLKWMRYKYEPVDFTGLPFYDSQFTFYFTPGPF